MFIIQPSTFLTWISCYSPLSSEPYSKHSCPFCQTSPHKKANILTSKERRFPKHQPVSSAKYEPNEEAVESAFRRRQKDGWKAERGDLFAFTQAGILRRKFQQCLIVFSCGPDGVIWSTKVRGAAGLHEKRGVSWVWENFLKERTQEEWKTELSSAV